MVYWLIFNNVGVNIDIVGINVGIVVGDNVGAIVL